MAKHPKHIKVGALFRCSYPYDLSKYKYGGIYKIQDIHKYDCVSTEEINELIHFCYCEPVTKVAARFYGVKCE
jgi:hypothetical protein